MADENNKGGGSIAQQVQNELLKSKRESLKKKLKTLFTEYNEAVATQSAIVKQAEEVTAGVMEKIVEMLEESGESVDDIQKILASK